MANNENKRTEKSEFWIGKFESEAAFSDFVGEDISYYESEEEDIPISKFVASQDEIWVDHDFMECGYEPPQTSLKEQFDKYSYVYNWGTALEQKCADLGIEGANTLVFIAQGQFEKPRSVKGDWGELIYVGVIEYEI